MDLGRAFDGVSRVLQDQAQLLTTSGAVHSVNATVVDGIVNRTGRLARDIGGELRSTQSGLVRSYAAYAALGAVALIAWFLVRTSF